MNLDILYSSTFTGAVVVVVVVAAGQEGVARVPAAVGRLLAGPHLGPHHLQQAAAHVVKHLKHLHNNTPQLLYKYLIFKGINLLLSYNQLCLLIILKMDK